MKLDDFSVPIIAIQLHSILEDVISKTLLSHKEIIPPEFPFEGLINHSVLLSFQIERACFMFIDSSLDSWMKTKCGLCNKMYFLSMFLFMQAPKPLIFQEITIIGGIDEVKGEGFRVDCQPNPEIVCQLFRQFSS